MNRAFSISAEVGWPLAGEAVADLLEFLGDREGLVTPGVAPAANDNWPLRTGSSRIDELPPAVIWNPRFRTAD